MTNSANVQTNQSHALLAGKDFGAFAKAQSTAITQRLLEDAKLLYTAEDTKQYCAGYKETLTGNGADAQTSMVRKIIKVLTAQDAKLNAHHKIKTPAQGQKVVKDKMTKGANGIDSLAKALRLPKPEASNDEGEGDSETGTNETHDALQAWWEQCQKIGHSDKFGLTNDEMLAYITRLIS